MRIFIVSVMCIMYMYMYLHVLCSLSFYVFRGMLVAQSFALCKQIKRLYVDYAQCILRYTV